ncbi:GNAT family N-acetyltransferase [Pseudomonas sp. S3E12]|jgi:GNAT superfamily N-acetyltransferase|uniref:GNAT family N-acetyltransferase n=2 Tax=unclassified Pseudomonas TaxID=196821 RepID=UPI00114CDC86|nr:GNAT family N-acetyltransferase [Pseudomonas sp. S3E12]
MTFEPFQSNPERDAIMQALITGWAKSRGGSHVSVTHGSGISHCIFEYPIGKRARDRETFCWGGLELVDSVTEFHQSKHHFLSVFGIDVKTHERLLMKGYDIVARETHMYKSISKNAPSPCCAVNRVLSQEEADWYNAQKGSIFIQPEHIADPDVYDFYTRERGIMTSHARAIRVGTFLVVDDVQTHPDFRRKGLASYLLATITSVAQQNQMYALTLISSDEGLPLYSRDNYEKGLSLTVYSSSH